MPTISMFYGILIRTFFYDRIDTISHMSTPNIRDKSLYTRFGMDLF